MLLYDSLLDAVREKCKVELYDKLKSAPVFVIDNVARYWAESSQEEYDLRSFPNLAPPYNVFFMEYLYPRRFNMDGVMQKYKSPPTRLGVAFFASQGSDVPVGAHWSIQYFAFGMERWKSSSIQSTDPLIGGVFFVRNDGSLFANSETEIGFLSGRVGREHAEAVFSQMVPMFLAISFLHCKNVTITVPGIPAALAKKARKKRGVTPVRYHVLEIEPLKKILRREGNAETTGLKHALHICRGHFKDYSQGAGLFGKYKGLYWWDSQVRGSVEEGVVVKDYKVNPPN